MSIIHKEQHPDAGKTFRLVLNKPTTPSPAGPREYEFTVEDWADRLWEKSWGVMEGNPTALIYAIRAGFSEIPIPTDDEVIYGRVNGLATLVHQTELDRAL